MALIGMDVEAVKGVGAQLNNQAEQIGHVVTQIDHLISQAVGNWQGNDAVQFHDWWNSQHKPALLHAQQAIAGLGQSAINNANDQATVSSH